MRMYVCIMKTKTRKSIVCSLLLTINITYVLLDRGDQGEVI